MHPPTIIVFESQPRWLPELRRQFAAERTFVRGANRTVDVLKKLTELGPAVVVLDVASAPGDVLQLLGRLRDRNLAVLAIGGDSTGDLEAPLYELGATGYLDGERLRGARLADICRRCAKRA